MRKQLSDRHKVSFQMSNDTVIKNMITNSNKSTNSTPLWFKSTFGKSYKAPNSKLENSQSQKNLSNKTKNDYGFQAHSKVTEIINTTNYRVEARNDYDRALMEERDKIRKLKQEEKDLYWKMERESKRIKEVERIDALYAELGWNRKEAKKNDNFNKYQSEQQKKNDV